MPCILSCRLLQISRENDKNLRLGPNPTVKVYNNLDLMEEANQDKRLMQKTAFGSSDSPTTSRGLWRAEKAGRTTKKPRGPEPVTPFVRKGGTGRGAILSILLWDARGVTLTGPSSL